MQRVEAHFGEWLQGRLGPAGPLALVTLRCPALSVRAICEDATAPLALSQDPPMVPPGRAEALLRALGLPLRGRFALRGDAPPGGGAGASTAALTALARAAAGAGGEGDAEAWDGRDPARLCAALIAAEGASDPLALPAPDAVLWAPREGRALRAAPPPPRAVVVGGFFGPPLRTDPADLEFPDVSDLIAPWMAAAAAQDLPGLAALASASAARTTALRGPAQDPTAALAARCGALGWARAHTGSARALIFAQGAPVEAALAALREAGMTGTLAFETGAEAGA